MSELILKPKHLKRRAAASVAIAVAAVLGGNATQPANAVVRKWDQGGGNTAWNTANNWDSAGANGVPLAGDEIVFDNTFVTLPTQLTTNNTDVSLKSITFDSANSMTLGSNQNGGGSSGSDITLTGQGDAPNTLISMTSAGTGTFTIQSIFPGANRNLVLILGGTGAMNVSNAAGTLDITSLISESGGARGINKTGAGMLILGGANTYTGVTSITAGTLAYGASNVISTGAVTVNGGTAVLDLGANRTDSVGTVTVDGGGSITGTGSSALTTTGNFEMMSGSVTAILAGGSRPLNKTTSGTVTLSGANTYTGVTTVSAGTLLVGVNAPSGSAGALGNASSTVLLGATSGAANASLLTSGAFTIGRNILAQSGNSGIMTLGGDSAHASTFSGTILLGTASGVKKDATFVALAGGSVDFTNVINESASVTGGVSNITIGDATHSGTVKFTNVANNYGGITTITNGATLEAPKITTGGSNSSIGNSGTAAGAGSAAADLVLSNGTLKYTGTGDSTNRLFTFDAGGGTIDASGASNAAIAFTGTGSLVASGTGNRTLGLAGSSTGVNSLASVIADPSSGTTALSKTGGGTWRISGPSTYSGGTTIGAGILQLGAANVIPDGAGKGNVSVTGGTFDLNAFSETINGLSGAGTVNTIAGGTPTLTVGNNNASSTFSGTITNSSGTLALTKTGAGTLNLNNPSGNSYSGATTVGGGTLLANNGTTGSATGTGSVAVNSGGTLGGEGRITGAVTANSGATVSPGNSVGNLRVGSATLAGGSSYTFELSTVGSPSNGVTISGAPGDSYDTLSILNTGASLIVAPVSGQVTVNLKQVSDAGTNIISPLQNFRWQIIGGSGLTPVDASKFKLVIASGDFPDADAVGGGSFSFSSDSGGVYLNYSAAPEPTSTLLFGTACSSLLMARRRRRR